VPSEARQCLASVKGVLLVEWGDCVKGEGSSAVERGNQDEFTGGAFKRLGCWSAKAEPCGKRKINVNHRKKTKVVKKRRDTARGQKEMTGGSSAKYTSSNSWIIKRGGNGRETNKKAKKTPKLARGEGAEDRGSHLQVGKSTTNCAAEGKKHAAFFTKKGYLRSGGELEQYCSRGGGHIEIPLYWQTEEKGNLC